MDACCAYLSKVSPAYLYSEEAESLSDASISGLRKHMTKLSLGLTTPAPSGVPPGPRMNGCRQSHRSLSRQSHRSLSLIVYIYIYNL